MNRLLSIVVAGMFCLFLPSLSYAQEEGVASFYADRFAGRTMANGEHYDPQDYTCAHLTAPLGSIIKVARKDNPDQSVMVIVTDRGPYVKGRIIDLSKKAAEDLGILESGIAEVVVAVIKKPETESR